MKRCESNVISNRSIFFFLVAAVFHLLIVLPVLSLLLNVETDSREYKSLQVDLWPQHQSRSTLNTKQDSIPDNATVVEVSQQVGAKPTKQSKYYSQSGSSVSKETRKKGLGKPNAPQTQQRPSDPTDQRISSQDVSSTSSLVRHEPSALKEVVPNPKLQQPTLKLQPDEQIFNEAVAGSGLSDLRDVLEGEHTALNSAAFQHAPFFNRVQKMVEQFWHPDVAIRQHDPETKIIGTKDRVTTLLVVLRPDGTIKKLYALNPSGAAFLDQEALDAVRSAAPFPNVPAGLINKTDGLVKFLFQFTIEINRKPAIRIRRYD